MAKSKKKCKSTQETNYLLSNEANRENLMESIHQAEQGKVKLLTPEEFNKKLATSVKNDFVK